ncbi:MAG: NAD(P)H-dependent oxidoreductase [Candidatus Odinarchaeota archaeon]
MTKDDEFANQIRAAVKNELDLTGWSFKSIELSQNEISPCKGCLACWTRTPGICIIDDYGREVAKQVINSDLVIFVSRVTFGGYSSELKKALERITPLSLPFFTKIVGETHHAKRYETYPSLLVFGALKQPDPEKESTFKTLVKRNALNLHSPVHRVEIVYSIHAPGEISQTIRQSLKKMGAN